MRKLDVYLQVNSEFVYVGDIVGNNYEDATFGYSVDYIASGLRPISISLPIQKERFSSECTCKYFEGLLPEGFSRKSVANWMHSNESDYLTILENLGNECLGAIRIGKIDSDNSYELLSSAQIKRLAEEGATESTKLLMDTHLSLTGASGKVGLYYDEKSNKWYLPHGLNASTHILKQSHVRYKKMVINEFLCMRTAKGLGIDVADCSILNLGSGKDEDVLYVAKRFDRVMPKETSKDGLISPLRLHQEDFGQAMGISASNKYEIEKEGYLSKMFDLVRNCSSNPVEDVVKLWDMILFNYLIGNTDSHIKNYSLLYNADFTEIRLAPAYDIVSSRAYKGTSVMAYYIGDEKTIDNIKLENIQQAAEEAKISEKIAMERYDYLESNIGRVLNDVSTMLFYEGYEDALKIANLIRVKR